MQSMITKPSGPMSDPTNIVGILARALLERRNDMREEVEEVEEEVWDE